MTLSGQPDSFTLRHFVALALGLSLASVAAAQSTPQVQPGAAQPLPPAVPSVIRPVDESLLAVPPVVDRPLGLDEGPRIIVSRFVLQGAADHSDKGLSLASLQQALDRALKAQPVEGYTVNQLQKVADQLSVAYRAKGYVLTQAFIPAQDVKNGEVHVQVLEGRLGAIRVEGNKRYRTSAIKAPLEPVVHTTVNQQDVEGRLLRLASYPGLSVFGVFTPGQNVGDSDLVLKVQREKALDVDLGADNYGSPYNGEKRGRIGLAWNSPIGIGDRLALSFLKGASGATASGADTKYYTVDYRVPVSAGRGAFTLAYGNNDYAVGGALEGIYSGRAKVGTAGFEWETGRSRLGHSYLYVHADTKKGTFNTATGFSTLPITAEEKLTDGEIGFVYDRTDSNGGGRWDMVLSALHGNNSNSGSQTIRPESDSSYTIGRIAVERLQRVTKFTTLRLHVGGQFTSNALPTLEETALGGPTSVRSYEVARYVGDKSVSGSLEYYMGAPGFAAKPGPGGQPWGQALQFVVFTDFGRGWLNSTTGIAQRDLKGAGVGVAFNLPHRLSLRIDVSKPLSATDDDKAQTYYKSTRVYASLGVTF